MKKYLSIVWMMLFAVMTAGAQNTITFEYGDNVLGITDGSLNIVQAVNGQNPASFSASFNGTNGIDVTLKFNSQFVPSRATIEGVDGIVEVGNTAGGTMTVHLNYSENAKVIKLTDYAVHDVNVTPATLSTAYTGSEVTADITVNDLVTGNSYTKDDGTYLSDNFTFSAPAVQTEIGDHSFTLTGKAGTPYYNKVLNVAWEITDTPSVLLGTIPNVNIAGTLTPITTVTGIGQYTEGTEVTLTFDMAQGCVADNLVVELVSNQPGTSVTTDETNIKLYVNDAYNKQKTIKFNMPAGLLTVNATYTPHTLTFETQDYAYDGTQHEFVLKGIADETTDKSYFTEAAISEFLANNFTVTNGTVKATNKNTYTGKTYTPKQNTLYYAENLTYTAQWTIYEVKPGIANTDWIHTGEDDKHTSSDANDHTGEFYPSGTTNGTFYWGPTAGLTNTQETGSIIKLEFSGNSQKATHHWEGVGGAMVVTASVLDERGPKIRKIILTDAAQATGAHSNPTCVSDGVGTYNMYTEHLSKTPTNVTDTYTNALSLMWEKADNGKAATTVTFNYGDQGGGRNKYVYIEYEKKDINQLKWNYTPDYEIFTENGVTYYGFDWTGSDIFPVQSIVDVDITPNYTLINPDDYSLATTTEPQSAVGHYTTQFIASPESNYYWNERVLNWAIFKNINSPIISVTVDPATFNGNAQMPVVKVYDNDVLLEEGVHYTLTYRTLDNGGEYKVAKDYSQDIIITGITSAGYRGTRTADFIISPSDIASNAFIVTAQAPYTTSGYTPDDLKNYVTIYNNKGETLNPAEFIITVADGDYKNAGVYADAVTVTAISDTSDPNYTGNYTGTVIADLVITGGTDVLTNMVVESKAIYTGYTLQPTKDRITVSYKNEFGMQTILGPDDYELSYNGAPQTYVDAKTYSNAIIITGKGEYAGTMTADYVIKPRDIADPLITLNRVNHLVWTGSDLTDAVIFNGLDAETNNIDFKLVADYEYALSKSVDFTYTTYPAPMTEPGEYTLNFIGQGNFTGTNKVNIYVLKDIAHNTVAFQSPVQIIPAAITLSPSNTVVFTKSDMLNVKVTDGTKVLTEGVHYEIDLNAPAEKAIKTDGVYTYTIKGLEPYYNNKKELTFTAVETYYPYKDANNTKWNQDFAVRLTKVIPGENGAPDKVYAVASQTLVNLDGTTASLMAPEATNCTINSVGTVTVDNTSVIVTVDGIADAAFMKNPTLRWIDASQLTDYVPNSLSRGVSPYETAFSGVAKQALVFLAGNHIVGENYVYMTANDDFRCEEFKIYDDLSGTQQNFSEANGQQWAYENPHEFSANKVTNTRVLNNGTHYTTCLPYSMFIPTGMKAYVLSAASSTILGFREVTGELEAFKPYVIIPETASSQPLSTGANVIPVFLPADDTEASKLAGTTGGGFIMGGTMRYMDKDNATGLYIMQGAKTWKVITGSSEYNGPCVLPMRAYIKNGSSLAKPVLTAEFTDQNGTTGIETFTLDADDWSNADVFDLQGRKIQQGSRNLPKGVYIVNGKKVIKK